MTKYFYTGLVSVLLLGLVLVPHTYAETATSSTATTSVSVMLEKIKTLMAQLEELKKQLATVRGEVKESLKAGIPEGTNSDDMKKIQELLATDPSIYPEGKVTGYYGPLTKEALKRFQKRHDLEVTGSVDTETRDLLEEYLHEGYGNSIPPGLMRAPGIMQKVEDRFRLGCKEGERGHEMGPLCKRMEMRQGTSTLPYRMEHGTSTEKMNGHSTSSMNHHFMKDTHDESDDDEEEDN